MYGDESSKQHLKETHQPLPMKLENRYAMTPNMNVTVPVICFCCLHRYAVGGGLT